MTVLQAIGFALVLIGVFEVALFAYLAPRKENIRRRMPLLIANSAFNVIVGFVLALI